MSIPSQEQVTLLTDHDAESTYSTAYQTLYANIRFNWDSERTKQQTILITTPVATPRQSEVAANLAIVAAQNGTPTVVVDANLRAPSLQQRFGQGESKGLSDLLIGNTPQPQAIAPYLCTTLVPGLRLLCAGKAPIQTPNPFLSENLRAIIASLRQLLAETENKPGLVIFNSPPVLTGLEAAAISSQVEQTFLTLVRGRTTRTQAKQAQAQLQRAYAKLAGVILVDL